MARSFHLLFLRPPTQPHESSHRGADPAVSVPHRQPLYHTTLSCLLSTQFGRYRRQSFTKYIEIMRRLYRLARFFILSCFVVFAVVGCCCFVFVCLFVCLFVVFGGGGLLLLLFLLPLFSGVAVVCCVVHKYCIIRLPADARVCLCRHVRARSCVKVKVQGF